MSKSIKLLKRKIIEDWLKKFKKGRKRKSREKYYDLLKVDVCGVVLDPIIIKLDKPL